MKKIVIALLMLMVTFNICFSQADTSLVRPTYKLTATNQHFTSATTFEFDVYLLHLNFDSTVFLYAAAQYFMDFNPGVANGGTLTYSIVSSELSLGSRPVNPTVSGSQLRLATNLPGSPTTADTIKHTGVGTRVLTMRLTNTVPFGANRDSINLRWRSVVPNPITKISAFTGISPAFITDISNPASHFIDPISGINPTPITSLIPKEFSLSQNYPNPFNPTTKIDFALPVEGKVNIKVYDITGRLMATLVNEIRTAGFYSVNFNGANFASGMYFYRINFDGPKSYESTRRMVLIK